MSSLATILIAAGVAPAALIIDRVLFAYRESRRLVSLPPAQASYLLAMSIVAEDYARVEKLAKLLEIGGHTVNINYETSTVSVTKGKK